MTYFQRNGFSESPSVLLVLDDGDLERLLRQLLASRGYDVFVARSGPSAVAYLRAQCHFDAILADWNPARGVGESLFGWVREKYPQLCRAFVALVMVKPDNFDELTLGECELVHAFDVAEVLRVTRRLVERTEAIPTSAVVAATPVATPAPPLVAAPRRDGRPSLLLVEDQPMQRDIMVSTLTNLGFSVTASDCGHAAIDTLAREDYDVILSDWYMEDLSGGDLYAWMVEHRPEMANRCVFMSASASAPEVARMAPRRPFVAKSAGPNGFLGYLTGIASRSRSRGHRAIFVPSF